MASHDKNPLEILIAFDKSLKNNNTEAIPKENLFEQWINQAWQLIDLKDLILDVEQVNLKSVSLFFCDTHTIKTLNHQYRGINQATNILSFSAFDWSDRRKNQSKSLFNQGIDCLGDLVFCPEIINIEAKKKYKKVNIAHWAHLTIHSLLHLCGYVHHETKSAKTMEKKEIEILNKLEFENPYWY